MTTFRVLERPPDPGTPDDIRTLRETLSAVESLAASGETVEELERCLNIVCCGASVTTPAFEAGLEVYRAVRARERPKHKRDVSYPPPNCIRRNGRLNCAGEATFYGCIGQAGVSFYECRATAGERFAIGFWRSKSKLVFNHIGYSTDDLFRRVPTRIRQDWMNPYTPGTRDSVLHAWQADVFTREVQDGQEHLYSICIALARLAVRDVVAPEDKPDYPREFAGVIYPSVALSKMGDNVVVRPSVIDSSFELTKVLWGEIRHVQPIDTSGEGPPGYIRFNVLDASYAQRSDGSLVWNSDGTALTVLPWP